jgi:hypothetical protein
MRRDVASRRFNMHEPSSSSRFPWGRLLIPLGLVAIFAVSRLLKGHREMGGSDAGRVLVTLVLWGVASALIVAVACFMHWRTTRRD